MLKIQMLPRYTEQAASSRLRVFYLAKAVNDSGLAEAIVGPCDSPDVVYMQKLDRAAMVPCKRTIYDYDDIWPLDDIDVSLFTTDTERHKSLAPGPCEVIPDMIDYGRDPQSAANPNGLVWFGNYPNFASVAVLLAAAGPLGPTWTICDKDMGIPNFTWAYREFPGMLRHCGTAFLSHSGADPGKSANKMVAAVTLGVPVIVHESPAYEELARAVGLDWCIVQSVAELREVWLRLQDRAEREKYLAAIQPYVWERYRPSVIARRFVEVCEGLA